MANLFDLKGGRLLAFIGKLAKVFTAELADAILGDKNADGQDNFELLEAAVTAIQAKLDERENKNPFQLTVEEQITALRNAIKEEGWLITEEQVANLVAAAPAWPKGRDSYRSLRIRFGEGDAGVEKTFEAHAARFKRVHAKNWRWDLLLSGKKPYTAPGKKAEDVERLRLFVGNASHKPTIEWCVIDLEANRQRKNISAVRKSNSLADEGVVLGWLFPKRVEAINYGDWCAWFLGGYELNVPGHDGKSWQGVPWVGRDLDGGTSLLGASWRSSGSSECSVPVSRVSQECQS